MALFGMFGSFPGLYCKTQQFQNHAKPGAQEVILRSASILICKWAKVDLEPMESSKGKEKMHATAETQTLQMSDAGSKGLFLLADTAESLGESDDQCFMDESRGEGNANVVEEKFRLTRIRQVARLNNNVVHKSHKKAQRVRKASGAIRRSCRDMAWEWGESHDATNLRRVCCKLCGKEMSCGVTRLKQHLLQIKGDVTSCPNVTSEIKKKITDAMGGQNLVEIPVKEVQLSVIPHQALLGHKHYQGQNHVELPIKRVRLTKIRQQARLCHEHSQGTSLIQKVEFNRSAEDITIYL